MLPACSKQRICSHQATTTMTVSPEGTQDGDRWAVCLLPCSQSLQPAPKDAPWGDSGWESTGYWCQRAEVHIRGLISGSPDLHLPIHRKALNSLRYLVFFKENFWCSNYLVFAAKTPYISWFPFPSWEQSLRAIWEAVSWAYVLSFVHRIKYNSQLLDYVIFSVNIGRLWLSNYCWDKGKPSYIFKDQ